MDAEPIGIQIDEARSASFLFRRQFLHLGSLIALVAVTWGFAAPALDNGEWLGLSETQWFWATIFIAVAHQLYVWIVWRLQLGWGTVTRMFGSADLTLYGLVFMPLLVARPLLLVALAIADAGSLALPREIAWPLAVALLVPALYAMWSVLRYFGVVRAMGADHFRERYRHMSLVDEGAFSWSPNAMYAFVFLVFWAIALGAGSLAALAGAFFQHAYIWMHYVCTEEPDMQLLYGD